METLAQKIKDKHKMPYQEIADKYNTHYMYVSSIANGQRNPKRGKGLLIKKELEKYANQ